MSEYIPSPFAWVAEQVELYEGSLGTEGLTLKDTGLPVIIVTHRGRKTGAIRKTPLMRVVDGSSYILVASMGGAPVHPVWYHNLKADSGKSRSLHIPLTRSIKTEPIARSRSLLPSEAFSCS